MKHMADNMLDRHPATPTTVLGVFRDKMLRLGRDEDGAALVTESADTA